MRSRANLAPTDSVKRDAACILQRKPILLANALDGPDLAFFMASQKSHEVFAAQRPQLHVRKSLRRNFVGALRQCCMKSENRARACDANNEVLSLAGTCRQFYVTTAEHKYVIRVVALRKYAPRRGRGDWVTDHLKIRQNVVPETAKPPRFAIGAGGTPCERRFFFSQTPRGTPCRFDISSLNGLDSAHYISLPGDPT